MKLTLSDVEESILRGYFILDKEVVFPLSEPKVFQTAQVDHGLIVWLDGDIDIAPESVYAHSFPYNDSSIVSA